MAQPGIQLIQNKIQGTLSVQLTVQNKQVKYQLFKYKVKVKPKPQGSINYFRHLES